MTADISLQALERDDLKFVHDLNNDRRIMTYWFEEPYESFDELEDLYKKHIHDQSERRFIAHHMGQRIGMSELVDIDYVHRRAEFGLIITPNYQGRGFARTVTLQTVDYAFRILNLNKLYLIVSMENDIAMHLYKSCGFKEEGELIDEYFVDGHYSNAMRMYQLQNDFLAEAQALQDAEYDPKAEPISGGRGLALGQPRGKKPGPAA